jgi:maleamate amidohydrolase
VAERADGDEELDRLHQDYRTSGFAGRLGFGRRAALVVVDVVRAYLEPSSPLYAGVETARDGVVRVLGAARAARAPVAFTVVRYRPGSGDGGHFVRKIPSLGVLEEGSPLGALDPALEPRQDELVVVKQYASAFFGTSLASSLVADGVDTVVVTGFTTSGCVRATAVDALQHGFRPIVVREAVGDRDPRPHEANLFDLEAKYADVCREDEVTAWFATQRPT